MSSPSLPIIAVMTRDQLKDLSEYRFQVAVTRYAQDAGWKVMYFRRTASRGKSGNWTAIAPPGWPDLFLARGKTACAVELKSEAGSTSPPQREWLNALQETGIETFIWRPRDSVDAMHVLGE